MSDRARTLLVATGFALFGLVAVVCPDILHGRLPGNLGDARFNAYLLEHFTLWLAGKTASFWNADFFYPFPLTIAFSDNYLGNGFVFAALRFIGFDGADALRGWFALGFVFNFAACAFVLTRLGYGALAAGAGAFLFSFGLPVIAQEGHVQLLYRFGVPLAVLALTAFAARGRLQSLVAILFWTVWQFYCSIYIGYFLCLLLFALAISLAVCRGDSGRAIVIYWPSRFYDAWATSSPAMRTACALGFLALLGLLALLFRPYFEVSKLYGFQRDSSVIEGMLPRLASYLLTTNSRLWQFSWSEFDALPMRPEHAMFVGVAPILAIILALFLRARARQNADTNFYPMLGTVLLLFMLTLFIANHSLYTFLEQAPGANAIRAVVRIGTVLLFPIAVLMASGLDALTRMPSGAAFPRGLACLIVGLMLFESAYVTHVFSNEREWRDRVDALEARLPRQLPASPILMVASVPDEMPYNLELDTMFLAQKHGWQTLNGYSGNEPHSYSFSRSCQDAARNIESGLEFAHRASDVSFAQMARRTVRVGYEDCDPASLMHRPRVSQFSGPLPAAAMAKTTIGIENMHVAHGVLHLTLALANGGPAAIPAISTSGTPVRISARYVAANARPSDINLRLGAGWELRQDIMVDIAPGETQKIDLPMPLPTRDGTYRVAVSVVQDGVAWFHDRGMPIGISHAIVTRDKTVKISE